MSNQQRLEALRLLHVEVALLTRNEQILERQKAALIAVDRAEFQLLQFQQEALLVQMELHQADRFAQLPQSEVDIFAAVRDWPQAEQTKAHNLIETIRILANRLKALSEEIRPLIANELKFVEFELDLIMSSARKSSHYARTGTSAASNGNRLLNQIA